MWVSFSKRAVRRLLRSRLTVCSNNNNNGTSRYYSISSAKRDEFKLKLSEYRVSMSSGGSGLEAAVPDIRAKSSTVYANVDTSLNHVQVYGFDFDYTLMGYNVTLQQYLYTHACRSLVNEMGYPAELVERRFDPNFAIRGLFYDNKTGILLKVDQFHKIVLDCVYFGREQLAPEETIKIYSGVRLSPVYIKQNLRMMTDLFCLPEANLYADVIELFKKQNLELSPRHISLDIRRTFEHLHMSGSLHQAMMRQPEKYFKDSADVFTYLKRLRKGGKKLFLITNSPYPFVNAGMKYALKQSEDIYKLKHSSADHDEHSSRDYDLRQWTNWFDVVICQARKPDWYSGMSPFRRIDIETGKTNYEQVTSFERGSVYTEGNLTEFEKFTGWSGTDIIYFGDHVYSDLAKPNKFAAWKTCAIMPEIDDEVRLQSDANFQKYLARSKSIQQLIELGQWLEDEDSKNIVLVLKEERNEIRTIMKTHINQHFGSVFRTASHRTNFFMEVLRYADIYTNSVDSMIKYPLNYCFYADRDKLPHDVN